VNVLGDGAVMPQQTGKKWLNHPAPFGKHGASRLADCCRCRDSPYVGRDSGFGQGRPKNVNRVWLRVYQSSGIWAGPSFDKLTEYKQRTTENYGTPPNLKTDEIKIDIMPSWQSGGQVCVRQSDPLPLTLINMSIDVVIGG